MLGSPRWFVGGMNVPVRGGRRRWTATTPLAWLIIDDGWVTLQLRRLGPTFCRLGPRFFGPFQVPTSQIVVAYPVRDRTTRGVGMTTRDGQAAFFWVADRDCAAVLGTLSLAGVAVDPAPRRSRLWALRRSGPVSACGVTVSPRYLRSLPVSMIAFTLVMAGVESLAADTPVLWRGGLALIWAIGIVNDVRSWRSARNSLRQDPSTY
jgi:hypothetical protein